MPTTTANTTTLRNRLQAIRSQWSPAERRRRAAQGLRRSRRLFALLLSATQPYDEISAIGAPACEDWRRVAG